MIFNLFRKPTAADAVTEAYRSIVAQSRQERFYADWGVPDTVTGRFDMVSLHMALVMHRLKDEPAARAFGQSLVNTFFKDMDGSLREMGVTDLGVPRKVRKMVDVFYGLAGALGEALDSGRADDVESVLLKNVYGSPDPGAAALASYLLDESRRLAADPVGVVTFASVAA